MLIMYIPNLVMSRMSSYLFSVPSCIFDICEHVGKGWGVVNSRCKGVWIVGVKRDKRHIK